MASCIHPHECRKQYNYTQDRKQAVVSLGRITSISDTRWILCTKVRLYFSWTKVLLRHLTMLVTAACTARGKRPLWGLVWKYFCWLFSVGLLLFSFLDPHSNIGLTLCLALPGIVSNEDTDLWYFTFGLFHLSCAGRWDREQLKRQKTCVVSRSASPEYAWSSVSHGRGSVYCVSSFLKNGLNFYVF